MKYAIKELAHADVAGEQPIPTNHGFQALISAPVERSKAYYFMTYPEACP